ncbi:MAG: NAD-dependent epimerase/dehydratase family protein [Actinobacteria bacterium]|nr:NAD-dependent epimerase/dehydratase family protein [Actinomycetota bacterium]
MTQKRALVLGGGGFIGGHLVKRLKSQGYWVRSVDLKEHLYFANPDEFVLGDLRSFDFTKSVLDLSNGEVFDEVYQLAADMGGAGYIFSGENDATVMHNSSQINLNVLDAIKGLTLDSGKSPTVFYSSSACIYPEEKQLDTENRGLKEEDAYPANPDSDYGWEKLFSERLYFAYSRNFGIPVRVARFHNIFGPEGTWDGGKEKAPAAICRKVANAQEGAHIEIWGDGNQTRSFLFIDECLDAIQNFMVSNFQGPINIGSEELVSINDLAHIAMSFENKNLAIMNIAGPQGVRGRNSDNSLVRAKLGWDYKLSLEEGLKITYFWIRDQLQKKA